MTVKDSVLKVDVAFFSLEEKLKNVLEDLFDETFYDIVVDFTVNYAVGIEEWTEYDLRIPQYHNINVKMVEENTGFEHVGFTEKGEYLFHL